MNTEPERRVIIQQFIIIIAKCSKFLLHTVMRDYRFDPYLLYVQINILNAIIKICSDLRVQLFPFTIFLFP